MKRTQYGIDNSYIQSKEAKYTTSHISCIMLQLQKVDCMVHYANTLYQLKTAQGCTVWSFYWVNTQLYFLKSFYWVKLSACSVCTHTYNSHMHCWITLVAIVTVLKAQHWGKHQALEALGGKCNTNSQASCLKKVSENKLSSTFSHILCLFSILYVTG